MRTKQARRIRTIATGLALVLGAEGRETAMTDTLTVLYRRAPFGMSDRAARHQARLTVRLLARDLPQLAENVVTVNTHRARHLGGAQ